MGHLVSVKFVYCWSIGRYSSLGGAQRLNRIILYGKNLFPSEKLQIQGAMAPLPPGSYAYGSTGNCDAMQIGNIVILNVDNLTNIFIHFKYK